MKRLRPRIVPLNPAQAEQLRTILALIVRRAAGRVDTARVWAELAEQHGATLHFVNGTHHLNIAGIAATCTSCTAGVIAAWVRAARRRLAQAGEQA
ncbi:hypothetical protein [Sphingomonas hengshuiensis]|uniref:Uncharacterized protein n=1 Tax=Sphingomonas hengshuiensis TaxID=1609977 RepID=A0A7U4JAA7_9SPHN|nr:hypothetical protein [Sphingomonas hengshuiensis]AJP73142.1 hypothetical protein TS85_17105 [Sphingomonas hengshuiensis]